MARIYDNIEVKFNEGLNDIITNSNVLRVDFCVGYFNLRGWNLVADQVDKLPGDYVLESDEEKYRTCRLLIGMHRPPEDLIRAIYSKNAVLPDSEYVIQCKRRIAVEFKQQLLLGIPSKNDEKTLRQLSKQLKDNKVCVKLYLRESLHAKLYLAYRPDDKFCPIQSIMGSSNLTYSGLTRQGELNAEFGDSDSASKLSKWFNDRWNDKFCLDITQELINVIDSSWASEKTIIPYYIYLKTVYHLSKEARAGINEFTISPEFKHDLFDFQQIAVKIAARNLRNEKRGGAMIGDVVGLGKTITACAIAKLYENTYGCCTLIICPANLQEMWKKYVTKYDLKAEVISKDKHIDVQSARYYRLIIVDESHNLRNVNGVRYLNIKELITHQDSNVLLLTATPYNKNYIDLSSQLKLFIGEDDDIGIRPENYIRELGGERIFMKKHDAVVNLRSIRAFEYSQNFEDWNELMKLFLVRRTRTFIKENYAKTDPINGRKYLQFNDGTKSYFPDRIPKAIKFKTSSGDQYSRLYSEKMLKLMGNLTLPRYGLTNFIDGTKTKDVSKIEQQIIDNLSRAGRRMMGFCKSTFFKRIDSCGYSFLLTIYRHILRNAIFVYAIENKLPLPIGDENELPDDFYEDEDTNTTAIPFDELSDVERDSRSLAKFPENIDDYMEKAKKYYKTIQQKNNISWIESRYFKRTLKSQLKKDCDTLFAMMRLCGAWNPDEDQKLHELQNLLQVVHKNEKVIVFTQYSDTALYVYKQLKNNGISNIYYATGSSSNPTETAERFSPKSNEANVSSENELRVLVATDVLSEGQNLQDSHVIVNYDLPWAIIRLIQRAGRVDRIGQEHDKIYCYSFFPAEGVEKIISLRDRLNKRINENASIVGSDEIFFEGNEQNLLDMYNEKNGSLDDEEDNDVDMASQAYQIWKNATDADPKLKTIIPNLNDVIYSTKKAESVDEQGVITYVRTNNDFDVLTWLDKDGNIKTQSQKKILQAMACSADEPALEPVDNHFDLVEKAVNEVKNESTNNFGGMLGRRLSTRYRITMLMEDFYKQEPTIFFPEENRQMLKLAIDEIYNYPLIESTKTALGQMLNRHVHPDDIMNYVIELFKNKMLCHVDDEKSDNNSPTIICSMGLKMNN